MRLYSKLLGLAFAIGLSTAAAQNLGPPGGGGGGSTPPGGSANQIQYNASGAFGGFTLSGDCTVVVATGAITCTKINGNPLGAPYFRVRQASIQSLAAFGTPTKITYDTVDFNVGSAWSATNHNFNPQVAGTYQICAYVLISGTFALGTLSALEVSKNGTGTVQFENLTTASAATTNSSTLGACGLVQMNGSTDTVEADASSNATTPTTNGTANRTFLSGYFIGP